MKLISNYEEGVKFEMVKTYLDANPDIYVVDDIAIEDIMFDNNITDLRALYLWMENYEVASEAIHIIATPEEIKAELDDIGDSISAESYLRLVVLYNKAVDANPIISMPTVESHTEYPEEITRFAKESILATIE